MSTYSGVVTRCSSARLILCAYSCQVVEHACVCLSRIAENWAPSSQKLDLLCSHGLIAQAARLIAVPASGAGPQAALSVATYTVRRPAHHSCTSLRVSDCMGCLVSMVGVHRLGSCLLPPAPALTLLLCVQGLVRLLATCAAGSPAVVEALLEQGIITILRDALAGAAAGPAAGVGPAALTRSPEQVSSRQC